MLQRTGLTNDLGRAGLMGLVKQSPGWGVEIGGTKGTPWKPASGWGWDGKGEGKNLRQTPHSARSPTQRWISQTWDHDGAEIKSLMFTWLNHPGALKTWVCFFFFSLLFLFLFLLGPAPQPYTYFIEQTIYVFFIKVKDVMISLEDSCATDNTSREGSDGVGMTIDSSKFLPPRHEWFTGTPKHLSLFLDCWKDTDHHPQNMPAPTPRKEEIYHLSWVS